MTETLIPAIEALGERLAQARAAIAPRFIGQEKVVDLALTALLSGGHALLVGLPGLGKTRLFSTILKREGDRFFLVTPVEKVGITVDDAPFVAVDAVARGEGRDQLLEFETNVGDLVVAGEGHAIRVERDAGTGEPSPYVHVRAGLEALIDRKTFYRLVDLGVHESHEGESWFGLWSGGRFWPVIPSAELG